MGSKIKVEQTYFQEALSDFMHDAASGDAVRHLVDLGYGTEDIMAALDFPTPRSRVEKTVYRYLLEKKVLLEDLPLAREDMKPVNEKVFSEARLCWKLREYIQKNGEEQSYVACPFGMIRKDRKARLEKMFSCLTARERNYLLGIPWEPKMTYHRLNSRMLEISVCMALHGETSMEFYFLKTKERLTISGK
ncbi:MAG: hypothetical protein Q4C50_04270 [Eubacteriales bacterium]|nr:hypothetical protein [Eubacteriales bacterium]